MVSPSPLQRGRNTEEEKRYRQHKQNDTDDEDPSLEVLFEHAGCPGPMNPLEESDSEAHQLRRNGRQREQRQNCEREQQHDRYLEGF